MNPMAPVEQVLLDFQYRGADRTIRTLERIAMAMRGAEPTQRSLARWDLLSEGVQKLGFVAAGAGASIIRLAADLQQARVAFTVFAGSASDANKHMKELMEFSARTPFQYVQWEKVSRTLQAYGASLKEVQGYLKMVGDIAAATGSQIEFVGDAIAQIRVGNVGVGLATLRAYGIPTGAVQERLIQQGWTGSAYEAPPSMVLQATKDVVDTRFNDMMIKQMTTLHGKFSNLIDVVKILGRELGDLAVEDMTRLIEQITSIVRWIKSMDDGTKSFIGRLLIWGGATTALIGTLGRLKTALLAVANAQAAAAVSGPTASQPWLPGMAQTATAGGMPGPTAAMLRAGAVYGGAALGGMAAISIRRGSSELFRQREEALTLRQVETLRGNTEAVEKLNETIQELDVKIAGQDMTAGIIGTAAGYGLGHLAARGIGAAAGMMGGGAAGAITVGVLGAIAATLGLAAYAAPKVMSGEAFKTRVSTPETGSIHEKAMEITSRKIKEGEATEEAIRRELEEEEEKWIEEESNKVYHQLYSRRYSAVGAGPYGGPPITSEHDKERYREEAREAVLESDEYKLFLAEKEAALKDASRVISEYTQIGYTRSQKEIESMITASSRGVPSFAALTTEFGRELAEKYGGSRAMGPEELLAMGAPESVVNRMREEMAEEGIEPAIFTPNIPREMSLQVAASASAELVELQQRRMAVLIAEYNMAQKDDTRRQELLEKIFEAEEERLASIEQHRQKVFELWEHHMASQRRGIAEARLAVGPELAMPTGAGVFGAFESYRERAIGIEHVNLREAATLLEQAAISEQKAMMVGTSLTEQEELLAQAAMDRLRARQMELDAMQKLFQIEVASFEVAKARGASFDQQMAMLGGIQEQLTATIMDPTSSKESKDAAQQMMNTLFETHIRPMMLWQRYEGAPGFARAAFGEKMAGGPFGAAMTVGTASEAFALAQNEATLALQRITDPLSRIGMGTPEHLEAQRAYVSALEAQTQAYNALYDVTKRIHEESSRYIDAIGRTVVGMTELEAVQTRGLGGWRRETSSEMVRLRGEEQRLMFQRAQLNEEEKAARMEVERQRQMALQAGLSPDQLMQSPEYIAAVTSLQDIQARRVGVETEQAGLAYRGFEVGMRAQQESANEIRASIELQKSYFESIGLGSFHARTPMMLENLQQLYNRQVSMSQTYMAAGRTTEAMQAMAEANRTMKEIRLMRTPFAEFATQVFGGPSGMEQWLRPITAEIDTATFRNVFKPRIEVEISLSEEVKQTDPEISKSIAYQTLMGLFERSPGTRVMMET